MDDTTPDLAGVLDEAIDLALAEVARHVDRYDALIDLRATARADDASTFEELLDNATTTVDRARLMALFGRITNKENT